MQRNRHLRTISQLCWAISSPLRHVSTVRKKLVKQQYLLWLTSLGNPSKFQWVSHLGFVTALTSLDGGQQNFVWLSAGLVTFLGALAPLTEFYQVQNSLCVKVFRSPILAALLHGTWAVGVSSAKLCGVVQRMELRNFRTSSFSTGCHLYSEGGHHVGHRPTF